MSGLRSDWRYGEPGYLSLNGTCKGCGGDLPRQPHQGMPRVWCSETCRVRAWRKAKREADQ